ncbi:MAG: hypothetical protein V4721_12415 [Bacteroidota bacterium]
MPVIVADSSYTQQGYVAPTVYLLKGGTMPRWNYYATMQQAIAVISGSPPATSAGSVSFTTNPVPQTFAINVDFYILKNGQWTVVDYAYMKNNGVPNGVIRIYTPTGSGPYWSTLNNRYFGISATKVSEYDPAKIAALDTFYREVALLKYRYNALVGFLNSLGQRQLTAVEQQIFNQGVLMLQNLNNQISQIKGIEITYTTTGAIGVPIILIIAIMAILSGVAGWTILAITTEREKTKRINDSYELNKWIATKKQEIAAQVTAGTLTTTQAQDVYKTLDSAAAVGNKVATESSKPTSGIFGEAKDLLKWGIIGLVAYTGYKLVTQKQRNAS